MIDLILEYLPDDGSTIGGGALKDHFDISDEDWPDIKDELKSTGKVYFGRGRGGSIRLVAEGEIIATTIKPKKKKTRTKRSDKLQQIETELKKRQIENNCRCELSPNQSIRELILLEEGCTKGEGYRPGYVCVVLDWLRREATKLG